MMHDREKSHSAIVAAKPTNKAGSPAAEPVEPRAGTKRNVGEQSTHRTLGRDRVTQALDRVRQAARLRRKEKFTALFHHLNIDLFREAFFALKRDAAPGVDGLTWQTYEADLDLKLTDLHSRVQRGAYRALPSRRAYIPKADGKQQRPLAVAALEDKIVQRATVAVLNCSSSSVSSMKAAASGLSSISTSSTSGISSPGCPFFFPCASVSASSSEMNSASCVSGNSASWATGRARASGRPPRCGTGVTSCTAPA